MKKYDKLLAILFGMLIIGLLFLAFTNKAFLTWAFERHQNQMSWYIRPLFIIPYCYFAYKRSWSGILGTIFLLFTSMFWFPEPSVVSEDVKQFLRMEKAWLNSDWTMAELFMSLTIPFFFFALGLAFWKRSLRIGLIIITVTVGGKIIWSIGFAGHSGKSVIVPALVGLLICFGLIYYGFKRFEKNK